MNEKNMILCILKLIRKINVENLLTHLGLKIVQAVTIISIWRVHHKNDDGVDWKIDDEKNHGGDWNDESRNHQQNDDGRTHVDGWNGDWLNDDE